MKLFRFLYTAYVFIVFVLGFIILLPFFLIFINVKNWDKHSMLLNTLWARYMFIFMCLPIKLEYRTKLNRHQRYVFCANHFSYLDIPSCGLIYHPFIFVGKSSVAKIPLFGYVYRKVHITVNRESLKSKYNTMVSAMEAVDMGKSVFLFPEGGIRSDDPPRMTPFKDGAFRVAIEKQIPVVPVTIPYNWIILPESEQLFRWKKGRLIIHEPIPTEGLTLKDVDDLKDKVFTIIDQELKKYFPEEETMTAAGAL